MADISTITLLDGTTYNIKDATARSIGKVSGVKGNDETEYRTGEINITPANIGAYSKAEIDAVLGDVESLLAAI